MNRKVLRERKEDDQCPTDTTERSFPEDHRGGPRRRCAGASACKIADTLEPWCHEATRDNIRHYAHGIGDDNPLWCDPAYAARTALRRRSIALPSFLFATSRIISGYVGGLPGIHAMWAGADWTLAQAGPPQRRDHDRGLAQGSDRARDQVRRPRDPADLPRRFLQPARRPGRRAPTAGASAPSATTRASRAPSTRSCKARSRRAATPTRSSPTLYKLYADGGDPRRRRRATGEDVKVGEALPTMVKGPMTVTGFIAYAQGWGGLYIRANKLAWKLHRRASRARHHQPLRHPRLSRARALGGGVRARGRRARRLRLRPRALLVADASPDQLDGRRRLPAQRAPARSAATTRPATCCSSRAR